MNILETNIIKIFVEIDDFCKEFLPKWEKFMLTNGETGKRRGPKALLSESEVMTILLLFQHTGCKTFSDFYKKFRAWLRPYFKELPSYPRFISQQKKVFMPLLVYTKQVSGERTGIYYVDSSHIDVCHCKRAKRHKTFAGIAKHSKSTMGWFFGIKIHLIINDIKQIVGFCVTSGNIHDTKTVPHMTKALSLKGKLIGDRGYISSKMAKTLAGNGIELVTKPRKNMKNFFIHPENKLLIKSRHMIETAIGKIKSFFSSHFYRHRSVTNAFAGILCAIINYNLSLNCKLFPLPCSTLL